MHRRRMLRVSSAIVALFGLLAVRGSLPGRSAATPLLTTTPSATESLAPQNFMPLIMMIPSPTPTLTPIPTITPIPTATATTAPAPPTATPIVPTATLPAVNPFCDGVANANAPNNPIAITTVNKTSETVTIRNVSAGTIDLSGWWICSMLGNQRHAVLSGTIAPGQTLVIPSQAGGPIWNNTSTDPAALYRRDGVQIGYRSQ
jgi:hypothetical protein